jgi:hypothetical protein
MSIAESEIVEGRLRSGVFVGIWVGLACFFRHLMVRSVWLGAGLRASFTRGRRAPTFQPHPCFLTADDLPAIPLFAPSRLTASYSC